MVHVQYECLVSDPLETIVAIYRDFGMVFGEPAREAISAHLAAHPRGSRQVHRYAIGEKVHIARERKAFERYEAYFKVPREAGSPTTPIRPMISRLPSG